MIIGTILVCDHISSVLFYLDFTFSYVSVKFIIGIDLDCEYLEALIYVSTLVKVFVCVDKVYCLCSIMFMRLNTLVELIILDIVEFDYHIGD